MFYLILAIFIVQRLWEMRMGKRHLKLLAQDLLTPIDRKEARQMLVLHSSWFVGLIVEFWWHGKLAQGAFLPVIILGLLLMQGVRLWTMMALKVYWVPYPVSFRGQKRIIHGLYKWMDHPNYWAVLIEFILLPLLGGCYITLMLGCMFKAMFLYRRIDMENTALAKLE